MPRWRIFPIGKVWSGIIPVAWLAFAGWSFAAESTIRIPHVNRAPKLADFLQGAPREKEMSIRAFRQHKPYDGQVVSATTVAHLSYDAQTLYVVFECHADRKTLRAHLSKRDDVAEDETVSISIDTFHDRRHAYMFFVNPLGVQMDGLTTEGQDDDFSFDAVWRSEGKLTSDGYITMIAIPFKSIRFKKGTNHTWGFSLSRYIPERNELSTFPYISRDREGYVEQFAALEEPKEASSESAIDLTPYLFMARERFLDDGGVAPLPRSKTEARGGLDGKAVLAGRLTLNATVNPDFSQVESDEPQVTTNQRYEILYPEHRPFFLENSSYFETPEQLFFSRRIVNPEYGARLTGRVGAWSIGLLGAIDREASGPFGSVGGREEGLGAVGTGLVAGSNPGDGLTALDARNAPAKIGVVRIEHDLSQQSTAGFLMTSRTQPGISNRVYSFDTRLRFGSKWVLTAQAAHSETTETGARKLGSSYYVELERTARNLNFYSFYRDRSPDFRSDLGYIPRVDIRQFRNVVGYLWRPSSGHVLSYGPSLKTSIVWDHQGRLQDWSATVPFRLDLRGQTAIEVARSEAFERFLNIPFRENNTSISIASNRLKHLGINGSWEQGRDVNYFPSAGLPFGANSMEGDFGFTLRPTARLRLDGTYLYSRLAGKQVIFTNHIARTKVNFQFSRSLSLRAIVDYNSNLPNTSLVSDDRSKQLTVDILLTYLVHPGTVVYVGYTNLLENLPSPYYQHRGFPGTSTGTQFFVKVSCLVRR